MLTRNQVIRHPQVEALGLVVETDHPKAGRLRQTRNAARFSKTPPEIRRGAPALGEHTGRFSPNSAIRPRRDCRVAGRWGDQRRLIPAASPGNPQADCDLVEQANGVFPIRLSGSIPAFYDRYLGPLNCSPYAADLAARVTVLAPARVLEVAAGTGIVTRAMVRGAPGWR